jgi:hypothetical protein
MPRRSAIALAAAGLGTLALLAPPANAAIYGHWAGESAKATIKLSLRTGSPNDGSLFLKNTPRSATVGHVYEIRCHKHGGTSGLVTAIQPITGSNPINLFGASGVRGTSCTITRDKTFLTTFTLHRA